MGKINQANESGSKGGSRQTVSLQTRRAVQHASKARERVLREHAKSKNSKKSKGPAPHKKKQPNPPVRSMATLTKTGKGPRLSAMNVGHVHSGPERLRGAGTVGAPSMKRINEVARGANPSNSRQLVGTKNQSPLFGKNGPTVGSLAPEGVSEFLASLDDPRERGNVRIPGTVGGKAAMSSMTAQTTATWSETVALNGAVQLCFSGHGVYSSSDDVANLCKIQTVNATNYVYGPYIDQTINPMAGVSSDGINAGTYLLATNALTSSPIVWDNSFPITNTGNSSDHQRYRMVSCLVTWQNTTEEVDQGGSVVTVQPQHDADIANGAQQGEFARYPTYRIHDATYGSVTTLPAAEDFAWAHNDSSVLAATTNTGTGLYVWLNAPAAQAQTYTLSVTANWELAGDNLEALSMPGLNVPGAVASVIDSVDAMRNAGIPGATKSGACDHVVRAAAMPPATRAIHGLPEDSEGMLEMASKLVGDIAPGLLMALL